MSILVRQLGELAMGSRLKRLSDMIMQDGKEIYKSQGIDFEPRWFLIYYQLMEKSPLSITQLAELVGISHSAVNQLASEMLKAGLIRVASQDKDKRKRMLELSAKGRELLP